MLWINVIVWVGKITEPTLQTREPSGQRKTGNDVAGMAGVLTNGKSHVKSNLASPR